MAGNFSSQVKAFADKAKKRQTAVFRESAQRLSTEANVPRAQGGNMPVDTGFLRGSMAASPSGMPATGALPPAIVLLSLQAGDTIFMGWTANYAIYMEQRYAFARLAAQNWDFIVNKVVKEVKARYP
jgi:hypothetical protein